jgi:hypothetical protein
MMGNINSYKVMQTSIWLQDELISFTVTNRLSDKMMEAFEDFQKWLKCDNLDF